MALRSDALDVSRQSAPGVPVQGPASQDGGLEPRMSLEGGRTSVPLLCFFEPLHFFFARDSKCV